MDVIKRDGRVVEFDKQKIIDAILAAFKSVEGEVSEYAKVKAENIAAYIQDYVYGLDEAIDIERIQDLVEAGLMNLKSKEVAKAYILYREERAKERNKKTDLMKTIAKKIMATDVQNQNANVDEYSFGGRAGEARDELLKDYALNYLVSDMAKQNHLNNEIYIHDLSSYALGCHNCFEKSTSFITSKGIKAFKDFNENDVITVLSPNGTWVTGIVKKYGVQPVNTYILKRNKIEVRIKATPNHRWLMEDGDFQEGLKIGDKLFDSPYFWQDFDFWALSNEGKKYWCYGFIMGDGTLETRYSKRLKKYYKPGTTKVKLCGEKIKYLPYFQDCGWGLGCVNKEPEVGGVPFNKTFPDFESLPLEYLIAFIHGLYEADGTKALASSTGKQVYSIQFSDKTYCDFVEKYFEVAGLYINSIKDKTGQETNFGVRKYTKNYQFTAESSSKYHWYVKDILYSQENTEVWCLDVKEGHAFTLARGIPTGNCLTIPFDEILAKGFNTRQVDIRPAQSVSTAFQLVAVIFQLQSLQQFGRS